MKSPNQKNQTKKVKKVPFSKLSESKKRVEVAKDVLAQIKSKKYIAKSSAYIKHLKFTDGRYLDFTGHSTLDSLDIKKEFKKIKQCQVCALGACLMSATKFENKIKFGEIKNINNIQSSENIRNLFNKMFSTEQILLIETSFEGDNDDAKYGRDVFHKKLTIAQTKKCNSFYERYEDDEKRLIAIMNNIIKHKGTFKL